MKLDRKVIQDLKKGKRRLIVYKGEKRICLPLGDEKCILKKGDEVVYQEGVGSIKKVRQLNYLTRYRIGDKWFGSKKVYAKIKGKSMAYVDLEFLIDKNIFITCEPEVVDFTSQKPAKLIVCGGGKRVVLPLSRDKLKLIENIAILKVYVDSVLKSSNRVVIGWNIKSLFSYVRHITGINLNFDGRICDLKIMEAFSGISGLSCPTSQEEAFGRIGHLASLSNWQLLCRHYKAVSYPLVSKVLPCVETMPLVHSDLKKNLYAHYEIEGQLNGRLRCDSVFENCYNPHTLTTDISGKFNPPTFNMVDFVYLDYKHMEVSVLQWLSNDPELANILESGEDLYVGIWEKITGIKCTLPYRKLCKAVFLPVIYGQGPASLAEKNNFDEKTASKLINKFSKTFLVAFDWIKQQQTNCKAACFACDFFGRRRQFKEQQYRVRNFVIQAAASTICLYKLVKLFESLDENSKIIFHVHDGYGLIVKRTETHRYVKKFISILEAEEDFFPGLKLKVSCKVGPRLDQLTVLEGG